MAQQQIYKDASLDAYVNDPIAVKQKSSLKEIEIEKNKIIYEINSLKNEYKMISKLKDNLPSIAALIAAVVAIGGGFVKYGEITTKLNQLKQIKE